MHNVQRPTLIYCQASVIIPVGTHHIFYYLFLLLLLWFFWWVYFKMHITGGASLHANASMILCVQVRLLWYGFLKNTQFELANSIFFSSFFRIYINVQKLKFSFENNQCFQNKWTGFLWSLFFEETYFYCWCHECSHCV